MIWFFYIASGVVLIGFIAPSLISEPDTGFVLFGVSLLLFYFWLSWKMWARKLFKLIKDSFNEL